MRIAFLLPAFPRISETFIVGQVEGLAQHNGLDESENRALMKETDVTCVMRLLRRGLRAEVKVPDPQE